MTEVNQVNQELTIYEDGSFCLLLIEDIKAKWQRYRKLIDFYVERLEENEKVVKK